MKKYTYIIHVIKYINGLKKLYEISKINNMERLENLEINKNINNDNHENLDYKQDSYESKEETDKKYYIIRCISCSNILSRSIDLKSIENDENKKFSYLFYPLFISIKTSKNKDLETINGDYLITKKISCLQCRNYIGKYIISSTVNLFDKLEKVKIENKACDL